MLSSPVLSSSTGGVGILPINSSAKSSTASLKLPRPTIERSISGIFATKASFAASIFALSPVSTASKNASIAAVAAFFWSSFIKMLILELIAFLIVSNPDSKSLIDSSNATCSAQDPSSNAFLSS